MSESVERRNAPRVAYDLTLFVAAYDGEKFPPRDQFVEVEGRDISTTGISYLSNSPAIPGSQLVIVAQSDAMICVTARVIHCQELPCMPNRYSIGCVLERRVDRNE
jgi:hypothetical protein